MREEFWILGHFGLRLVELHFGDRHARASRTAQAEFGGIASNST